MLLSWPERTKARPAEKPKTTDLNQTGENNVHQPGDQQATGQRAPPRPARRRPAAELRPPDPGRGRPRRAPPAPHLPPLAPAAPRHQPPPRAPGLTTQPPPTTLRPAPTAGPQTHARTRRVYSERRPAQAWEHGVKNLYIAGKWTPASDEGTSQTINPFDATPLETVAEASASDVDTAVAAAREAFDTGAWRRSTMAERTALLVKIAEWLQRDKEQLAHTESLDTGKTLNEARADVDDTTAVFRYYAGIAGDHAGRVVDPGRTGVVSRITHEPVGVCALIAPWNYPLLQISWKLAPALAAGNTTVVKPSELTPLSTVALAVLCEEAE